ncbi:MAG TPA: alcohol dehydrogenase catalytic domain-containing protein [Pyrinomonadaceae bacterium]|jgi:threonine dehydrogenase-like Zn-dependent dehydrogenase|nr:alcohol dehydrogenase catalytic domain-containing protein [Pyrinomonadaceae bacterium]
MKALRYEENRLAVRETPLPSGVEDEALVRVTLSGVCNTDVEIVRGYAGFRGTLGHEFVGVVESAPGSSSSSGAALVGKRVVGEINAGCGHCRVCATGDPRHCPRRTVLGIVGRDGAHAEFLRLPVVNLLPVPDEIPDERAVFAEPLAAAYGITERAAVTKETRVAVIGDGKLGLLCAQALALAGGPVLLIGKHPEKLRIAARRGIETVMLDKLSGRAREFDTVVEASGAASGFELALELVRPRGTLVLKSTFQGATNINAARIVVDEISVVGSRCGRFAPALELLQRHEVDVESLISEEFPLAEGVRAMERATAPGVIKVLLRM